MTWNERVKFDYPITYLGRPKNNNSKINFSWFQFMVKQGLLDIQKENYHCICIIRYCSHPQAKKILLYQARDVDLLSWNLKAETITIVKKNLM